jgi:type I restriction enzyme, S subunit
MGSEVSGRPLGEVAEIVMGQSPPGDTYNDDGVGVVLVNGPAQFGDRVPLATKWTTAPTKLSRRGDVMFCVRGSTTGRMVRADAEYCLGRGVAGIRGETVRDSDFIYYAMQDGLDRLLQQATGSTFPNLSSRSLSRFDLPWPDTPTRHAIAEVLGALDDRIEWCRTTQQLLRATLHARFQSEFRVGDLARLGDVTETVPGRSYKSTELDDASRVGLVNLKNILRHGGFNPAGVKGYTGAYRPQQVVRPGDLVIACTDMTQQGDVIGRAGRVRPNSDYPTMVISMDMATIRPAVPWLSAEFLAEVLSTREYVDHVKRYVNGTTVLHLKRVALAEYETALPAPEVIAAFTKFARPMWARHDVLDDEAAALVRLRDSLLPRLLSGQLRIEDPAGVLGAVA